MKCVLIGLIVNPSLIDLQPPFSNVRAHVSKRCLTKVAFHQIWNVTLLIASAILFIAAHSDASKVVDLRSEEAVSFDYSTTSLSNS